MKTQNTPENKARFMLMHMTDGQQFVLTKESYYDVSSPTESIGHAVKREGFKFIFDWLKTPNCFRYGNGEFPFKFINKSAVELIPLSQISDEDAIELAKIAYPSAENWSKKQHTANKGNQLIDETFFSDEDSFSVFGLNNPMGKLMNIADFLRSKGYLIGWLDLTAEDILAYGWAVERSPENG